MLNRFFLIIFLFINLSLQAIENRFSFITPEDGLSQGNITCIFQDHKGFMWFGTFNGLNRFDGYSIKIFDHDLKDSTTIGHGYIRFISEDDEHNLLIGTYGGGFSIYYPKQGYFRNVNHVFINNYRIRLINVISVLYGYDGNYWVADENQGIFVFDKRLKLIKAFRTNQDSFHNLPRGNIQSLLFDKFNNCWIGIGNGILSKLSKGSDTFENYYFEKRVAALDDGIKTMYIDKENLIWIGTTSQGAYSFNPTNHKFKNYREGNTPYDITGNIVMAFCDDRHGNLLIGIDGGGLNIYNRKTQKIESVRYNISNNESLNTDAVYSIFIDRSHTLWVGTYAGGLNYQGFYKTKFKLYHPDPLNPNSLSYKNTKCIMEDKDGEIWIGTDGGGLNRFDRAKGTFKHFRADPKNTSWLQTDVIIHMMQDNDGDIYLGSYSHGLTIFNKKTEKFKQYLPIEGDTTSITGIHPWYCFQDSYGDIWIGMLAVGLDKFDKKKGTFKHYIAIPNIETTLNSPNIKVIYEDSKKRLWVGTEGGGLHQFVRETDNFIRYYNRPDNPNSISNNDVRAICEDKKGRLWIGTGMGLNLFDVDIQTFKVILTTDGLPGNTINDILEDDHGNLWLSTNMGISMFNPDKMTFRNYDITDGLQGNEFNYTAAIRTKNGEFYFGGKNGFNVFKPDEIKDNPFAPEVVITDIQLFNKSIDKWKTVINVKEVFQTSPELKKIELTYKENVINFEFAALEFGNAKKNRYKYKLEGFDKGWNEAAVTKRFASYSNLVGGTYIFRVIASNSDGIWNLKGASLKIVVLPPWWKTWWFRLFAILLFISSLVGFYRTRFGILKRKKLILEKLVLERTKEIEVKNKVLLKQTNRLNESNTLLEERQQLIEEQSEELQITADELIEKNQTLIDLNETLSTLNATKDKFFTIIAHDLKNPFNAILGFSEILLAKYDKFDDEKRKKLISSVFDSSTKIYKLLENLLQWACSQTGSIEFEPEEFNLSEIIDSNILLVENLLRDKNIRISNHCSEDQKVYADKNMVNTVVLNLITNAIKFCENGTIIIECEQDCTNVIVKIKDTGTGIDPEKLKDLFNITSSKSTNGTWGESGTGLGLILCKEFIEKNNGKIDAKSEVGKGSTFYFTLPRKKI